MRSLRPARALALLLAATALLLPTVAVLVLTATPAQAHAVLVRADPPDGAVLAAAPTAVRLAFNEPVDAIGPGLRVFAADGTRVDLARPPERADVEAGDRSVLAVALPRDLPDGGYVVAWRVRSADGHAVAGTLRFTVGDALPVSDAVAAALADSDAPAWLRALDRTVRAALLIGLVVAAGTAVAGVAVARTGRERDDAALVTARAALAALVLVPVALWLQAAVQAGTTTWPAVSSALASGAALPAALVRGAGLALLVVVARRGMRALATVPAAALALLPLAGEGHQRGAAGAAGGGAGGAGGGSGVVELLSGLLPGLDAVHVSAGAVWVGAVLLLAIAVSTRGAATDADTDADAHDADAAADAAALAARVGRVALASLGVVTLAGVAQASVLVGSLASLTTSAYGVVLVVKVAFVVAAVAVAGLARRHVRATSATSTTSTTSTSSNAARRLLRVELALLGAAIVATGALVTLPPPVEASSTLFTAAAPLGDGLVLDVGVDTGRPGRTELHVYVIEGAGLTARPLDVRASFTSVDGIGPFRVAPLLVEPGHWFAAIEPLPPGDWLVEVVVGLDRFTERTTTFTVRLR